MKQNFCSDAETYGLPVTNQRDGKGASLLEVDRVVRASYPSPPAVGYRQSRPSFRLLALIVVTSAVVIAVVVAVVKG